MAATRPDRTRRGEALVMAPAADLAPRLQIDPGRVVLASRDAYPIVGQRPRRSGSTGLAAGTAVALLIGGVTLWTLSGPRAAPPPTVRAVATLPAPVPQPLPAIPPIPPLPAAAAKPVSIVAIQGAASPAMVFDGSAAPAPPPVAAAPSPSTVPASKGAVVTAPASLDGDDQFAARVGGSEDVAVAGRMGDPTATVTQGTLIPAVLETAIDTDLPGYVRAVVSRDVRSFDGQHVLIPRSTRLIGQYKSGLAAGQTRAYVIWTRLIRPDGFSVALGSPAVDDSGRTGLGGTVDGHFLKRFGAATLLTVIGGLSAIGNNAVVLSSGQNVGAVAAQGDAQIPPTIRVPQGQPIRVFTARDLDFSTVAAG